MLTMLTMKVSSRSSLHLAITIRKTAIPPPPFSHAVLVHLDEPLWVPKPSAREVAVEMISLCIQLDSIVLSDKVNRGVLIAPPTNGCGFHAA